MSDGSRPHDARPVPDLPVPEHLLTPVLEIAADALRGLDPDDVPRSLEHLHGFDRRGLMHGPGPKQLRRALEHDAAFRERVRDAFVSQPQVDAMRARWEDNAPGELSTVVDEVARRHDLGLLASVLWMCDPPRAAFGLGLVVERAGDERRARDDADAVRARDREVAELDEARRRAEAARMNAEAEAERALDDLREERRARRAREERAESDAQAARRHAELLQTQLEQVRAEVAAERARTAREAARARAVEEDLARVRAELAAAAARLEQAPSRLDERDARVLNEVTAAAYEVATRLETLRRRATFGAAPAETRDGRDAADAAGREREPPLRSRVAPSVPAGLLASSPEGIEAMLRTPGVQLVVDGYNVSKRAWPDATAADQRERLAVATTGLNRRLGCGVLLVFDGEGSGARPVQGRGVRVVFSDAGEEADEVVVQQVAALPKRVPVVVVSSDAWVREHAGGEGAAIVDADAFLGVLRPSR